MKKISAAAAVLMIIFIAADSHGLNHNRKDWWKIKHASLVSERAKLAAGKKSDQSILDAVDRDIRRAAEMNALFITAENESSSLSNPVKEYTQADAARIVDNVLRPAFAVVYLESFTSAIMRPDPRFEEFALRNLETAASAAGVNAKYLAEKIWRSQNKESTARLWISFVAEGMKSRMNDAYSADREAANTIIAKNFSAGAVRTTEKKIIRDAISAAEEVYSVKRDVYALIASDDIIKKVPEWKELTGELEREVSACAKISSMLTEGKHDIERITALHTNPSALDNEIFSSPRDNIIQMQKIQDADFILPEYASIIDRIDSLRRRNISIINGRERADFFNELQSGFESILARGFTETENYFFREGELLKNLSEKEQAVKKEKLSRQRAGFESERRLFNDYALQSLEFTKYLTSSRAYPSEKVMHNVEERFKASSHRLNFVKGLIETGSMTAQYGPSSFGRRYSSAVQASALFFKTESASCEIKTAHRAYITTSDLAEFKNKKAAWSELLHRARMDSKNFYADYSKKRDESYKKKNDAKEKLDASIAQHELNMILANARDYVALYESMKYAEEAIAYYALKHREFESQAAAGRVSDELDYSIKMNSIAGSIKSFSPEKFSSEHKTKIWAKRAALVELSRLVTLINFYKRMNVDIKYIPGSDEIALMKNSLNRFPWAKIADWRITESNFTEVDKKAAKRLSDIVSRGSWNRTGNGTKDENASAEFRSNGITVFFEIPFGWNSDKKNPEGYTGRRISSPDGEAYIEIEVIDAKGGLLKDTADRISALRREKTTSKKWGKKGSQDFYWFIARKDESRVCETFAIEHNGRIIIVRGETGREKYSLFKKKINALFDSIKL